MKPKSNERIVSISSLWDQSALPARKPPTSTTTPTRPPASRGTADPRSGVRALMETAGDRFGALERIVMVGKGLTGADGFAIALPQGNAVVCECSMGLAPKRGTGVSRRGYSAECLRSAEPIYCRDLLKDQANTTQSSPAIRSALLVPILRAGEAVGLLAAFSAAADAFQPEDQEWMTATAAALADAGFVSAPAGRSTRGRFGIHTRYSPLYRINSKDLPVLVGRTQEWLAEKQQQGQVWSNVSLFAGILALVVLVCPRYVAIPYWVWLLTGPMAVVSVVAGHYARFVSLRAPCGNSHRSLVGLVFGYVTSVCFALMLALLQSDL